MPRAWLAMLSVGLAACGFEHGRLARDAAPPDPDADAATEPDAIDAGIAEVVVVLAANEDDALQDPPPGQVLVTYSWMSLYSADHWGAMRFFVPQVMRGATIVDAYLDVYVDTGSNEDDPDVAITSEASAMPAALAATNNNISNRPRGTARVMWKASNIGSGMKRSPSIASIVQERVDDTGWAAGQPILFVFDTVGPTFEVRQRDHTPVGMYAPRLTVRFINP